MWEIGKVFHFSSSHQLKGLEEGHKCGRLHGHNYSVEFIIQASTLNEHNFVIDYGDLEFIKEFIDNNIDHRHLNDCIDYKTTAENLSFVFFQEFKDKIKELGGTLTKVIVRETDKTFASYSEQ
jgi:6-pyruvoyltetrahydropterin/6-carboxytetrahydropterin synthase